MLRKFPLFLLLAAALLAFSACSQKPSCDANIDRSARVCIDMLRQGRYTELAHVVPAEDQPKIPPSVLFQLRELLSTETGPMTLVGEEIVATADHGKVHKIAYEMPAGSGWLVVSAVLSGDGATLYGLNAMPVEKPVEELVAFTFRHKSWLQFAFLAATLCTFLFVAATFFLAILRGKTWTRWLWAAFILVGVGTAALDWNSGMAALRPFSVQLLSASFTRPDVCSPWIVSLSVPVGALAWWVSRWQPKKPSSPESNTETAA